MKGLRKYAMTLLATASLVTIVLLVTGWGSAMAAQVQNVVVTNTASQPVPVQATETVPVHEQGTASVNVANSSVPVHEQGIASVQQAGTPMTVHFTNLSTYTVPVGKRLLIEYVSGLSNNPKQMILEVLGGDVSVANFRFATSDASNEFVTQWVMSQQVTIFAGPGAQLEAIGGTTAEITATGYLVDA